MVLKMGHCLDTTHPVHKSLLHMKKRLEELSGGKMTIDIYPSGVLGSEVQCIEQLQNGSLAMTKTSAAAIENFIPEMSIFGLPYVFRDSEHYWKVLDGKIGHDLLKLCKKKFLYGLCYFDAGSRNFYTRNKPVKKPEDLQGLKIRVQNSQTAMDMVEAMGGSPTPISWGELYSALAQGIVDGAENNPPSFTNNKHYEVCKHFTLDGHTRIPDMLFISTKVWNRLSQQQRQWLQQAAGDASVFERQLWKSESQKALKEAEKNGVTVYHVDTSLFAEKVKPMLENVKNPKIKTLLKDIKEVK
jgi:tripartite ATP-independent transporter DctP family solute receptor